MDQVLENHVSSLWKIGFFKVKLHLAYNLPNFLEYVFDDFSKLS